MGQARKTDATDAHSIAVVSLRTQGLRVVKVNDATVALCLLVDRRDELGGARTLTVNRSHLLRASAYQQIERPREMRHRKTFCVSVRDVGTSS